MQARLVAAAAALLALAVAGGVLARPAAPPDPLAQATQDGCERNETALRTLEAPNWVFVDDKDYPAAGPAPSLRFVSGVVQRRPLNVRTSFDDYPISHVAHDLVFDLDVAAAGRELVAKTNPGRGLRLAREESAVPLYVWPEPGDRVTARGYWVWDCGRFATGTTVTGEPTELHPWLALWVSRAQSSASPTGELEADLYLTTEKTEAAKSADCAHRMKRSRAMFRACVPQEPKYVDMSGRYEFTLPAAGRVRVADMGSRNAPPIRISGRKVSFVVPTDRRPDRRRRIIAKRFFVQPRKASAMAHVRVTFEKLLVRRSMDPGCSPPASAGCNTPETVNDEQATTGPGGEWNLYADVAGHWSAWTPRVLRLVRGQTISPRKSFDVWLPVAKAWRVFVWTRECDWGSSALGGSGSVWPCPKQGETGDPQGDDAPGGAVKRFRSVAAAIGTHSVDADVAGSTCPAVNRRGCYSVTFSVRRLDG
jgi:hypothetical protein